MGPEGLVVVVVGVGVVSSRPSAQRLLVGPWQTGRLGGCRRGPWSVPRLCDLRVGVHVCSVLVLSGRVVNVLGVLCD